MTDDDTRPLRSELGLDDDPRPDADGTATTADEGAAHPGPEPTPNDRDRVGAEPTPWPPEPTYRSGMAPFALLLGILGLVTAAAVLVSELTDVRIPWTDLGPWTVVGGGALVVLVGIVGLRGSRAQD